MHFVSSQMIMDLVILLVTEKVYNSKTTRFSADCLISNHSYQWQLGKHVRMLCSGPEGLGFDSRSRSLNFNPTELYWFKVDWDLSLEYTSHWHGGPPWQGGPEHGTNKPAANSDHCFVLVKVTWHFLILIGLWKLGTPLRCNMYR